MAQNEYVAGQKDTRPWGDWEVLDAGDGYAVKRIRVLPGERLSLQRHQHRSEHWLIVAGMPVISINNETRVLQVGESVIIGVGDIHRIINRQKRMVVIIETQFGAILREDDIERLQDLYGRA